MEGGVGAGGDDDCGDTVVNSGVGNGISKEAAL